MNAPTPPPFRLSWLERQDDLEDTGLDWVNWIAHLEMDGKDYWTILPFDHVWRWTKTAEPEVCAYFDRARGGIAGWGPKHTRMFAFFDDEGFDFEPLVERYFLANYSADDAQKCWSPAITKRMKPEVAAQLQARLADLAEAASGARHYAQRWDAFAEPLLAFATEKAVEVYPEILESGPERIEELGHALYDTLRGVADAVAKVAHESKKA